MGRIKSPLLLFLLLASCSFPLFVRANPSWFCLKFQSLIINSIYIKSSFILSQAASVWILRDFILTMVTVIGLILFAVIFSSHVHICLATRYFQCDNGLPRELTCPAGLLWNQDLLACDWSSNVKCSSGSTETKPQENSLSSVPIPSQSGPAVIQAPKVQADLISGFAAKSKTSKITHFQIDSL